MNIHPRAPSFLKIITSRLRSSRRGAAAVEFALLAPIVLAVLAGVANYGMAMIEKMELESAARAGAQMAANDRTATTTIQNAVINANDLSLTAADITLTESCWCADVSATATCGSTCADGDSAQYFMTVSVSTTFDYLFGFDYLVGASATLTGSAKVRTQ
ncbi:MAG: pilus assembly protein [Rhodospirillales bacterium]|nr:pilus assembly protein [Rhodospirillales bacterium]